MKLSNYPWLPIAFFSVMAILIAGIFRDFARDSFDLGSYHFFVTFAYLVVFVGWAPAASAFLSWKIFGLQNRSSSWFGSWRNGALMMALVPPLVLAIIGFSNDFGMNKHLAGGLLGGLIFLYALGEEIGWRCYMQDALEPRPLWRRGVIIGLVWWLWHLFFLRSQDPGYLLESTVIIMGTAFLFTWLMSELRSWLAIAAYHAMGNIAFMTKGLEWSNQSRFVSAGIMFVILLTIHHLWKRRSARKQSNPELTQ